MEQQRNELYTKKNIQKKIVANQEKAILKVHTNRLNEYVT